MPDFTEWITTKEAAELTGYSIQYVRRLVRQERVKARKWANTWMIDKDALFSYKEKMDGLGDNKFDPWRTGAREKSEG